MANIKIAYQYDKNTKEYISETIVMEDPLNPGHWLLPPDVTEIKPPEYGEYQKPVWDEDNKTWNIVPDYRQAKVYSVASDTIGQEIQMELGQDLGNDKTLIPPPPLDYSKPYQKLSWNGTNWEIINDLEKATQFVRENRNQLLRKTDWLILRHQDEIARGVQTTLTNEQYIELLNYRQALRDLPQQSDFDPLNPQWPTPPSWLSL